MKKLFKIILGATVGSTLLLSSCNFLDVDPYFEATFKEDSIFHSKKNAEGYLWNTPKGFPDAGAIWGNSWNPGESASDEITLKYQTNEFWGLQFSVGTINSRNLPIQNQWYDMYVIVARCNKMLKEVYNVPDMNEMDRRRYIGYVHFMRGYAYYHLLMNWGPLIIVGDEELSTSEPAEYYNRERATYDESVDYICDEFRLATQGIYSADEQSVNYYQRPTKGAAMALIARLRLFQASPLFNGGAAARKCFGTWKRKSDGAYYVNQEYDPRRWAVAAAAAKQLTKMGLVQQFVKENKLEETVLTLGRFPSETMPLFFAKADVMLVSLTDSPLFNLYAPAKISSYMASGRPIIACLNGEGAELIKVAECGWHVAAGDANGLAQLVMQLADKNKDTLLALGQNGIKFYDENFQKDKCLKKLDQIVF